MKKLSFTFLFLYPFILFAQKDFSVRVHTLYGPENLNPILESSSLGYEIGGNIFQNLLDYNRETLELEPVLAKCIPSTTKITNGKYKGGMAITYEIHPDAIWDNGEPVTADDYIFTIKAIKNPKVYNYIASYIDFIDEIVVDTQNRKKFTIYSSQVYFRAVDNSGAEVPVLPEYYYDKDQLMRRLSIADLDEMDETTSHPEVIEFAKQFNAHRVFVDVNQIVGSGPYQLTVMKRRASIILKRKKNWWGDKVENNNLLAAYPDTIHYKIIRDWPEALTAAENDEVDILTDLPPYRVERFDTNKPLLEQFELTASAQFAYHYLGLNTKSPKLKDIRVRKAIAHAVDRDYVINDIFNGYAERINTPVSPHKYYYNNAVKGVELDLEKAQKYLVEAGWVDHDNDGIVDQLIDGKREKLSFSFLYNQGHQVRKRIGQILKKNLEKIGVELKVEGIDFPTLLERADSRDFEIIALAWVQSEGLDDMKQLWHTTSDEKGGANRVGFGDATSDKILEEIEITLDTAKRKDLYLDIQQRIATTQSYIFLVVPLKCSLISKRLASPKGSIIRPTYIARFCQPKKE